MELKEIYCKYIHLKKEVERNERIRCPYVAARYRRELRQLEKQFPQEISEIKLLINEK